MSLLRRYLEQIKEAWNHGRTQPVISMSWRPLFVYAFTLAWVILWWQLGAPRNPRHFFTEGSPIDFVSSIYLGVAGLMAWAAWFVGAPRFKAGSWFWLLAAAGLLFLSIDERFQFHEHEFSEWQDDVLGPVPLGLRNWNDAVVVFYGMIALPLFGLALPAILRYRGFGLLLAIGFVFFAGHTFLDSVDDFIGTRTVEDAVEESMKLFAGASLMLAFLRAALARAAEAGLRARAPTADTRLPWSFVAGAYALAMVMVIAMMIAGPNWEKTLTHRWGDPTIWFPCYLLGVAAVLCWLAALPTPHGVRSGRWFWYATAAVLAVVALDHGTIACQWRFTHDIAPEVTPVMWQDEISLLRPIGPWTMAVTAVLVGLVGLGWSALARPRQSRILAVIALLAFLALITASLVFSEPDDTAPVRLLFVLAGASLVLSALSAFVGRVLAVPTDDRAAPAR